MGVNSGSVCKNLIPWVSILVLWVRITTVDVDSGYMSVNLNSVGKNIEPWM
jgi:hypothetical protein